MFTCKVCGKEELGNVYCLGGHYVCEGCHSKGTFELILGLSQSSKEINPLLIAESIMQKAPIPMLGCEHAWVASGALLAAIMNHSQIKVSNERIAEALNRTRRQAIGAYCGLTGVCGIAPAIGASFSVILGAACPKDKETATTMHVLSRIVEAIANQTGPCCCKNFVRTALTEGCKLVNEYLGIDLPQDGKIVCQDSHRHPHGCRKTKCNYYQEG